MLVTEIDNPDEVFTGEWVGEQRLARALDGDIDIRLGRAEAEPVDAELILAHGAHPTTVVRPAAVGLGRAVARARRRCHGAAHRPGERRAV